MEIAQKIKGRLEAGGRGWIKSQDEDALHMQQALLARVHQARGVGTLSIVLRGVHFGAVWGQSAG